jgi:large subunit ribosomal protein L13
MIVDGKGIALGRISSFAAKEALKGSEVFIVNSEEIIITGNRITTKKEFEEKRSRIGHSQKGPKHPALIEKMVKRAVRGMLPDHRSGRGKEAFNKIKCFKGVPREFEGKEIIQLEKVKKIKAVKIKEFAKDGN